MANNDAAIHRTCARRRHHCLGALMRWSLPLAAICAFASLAPSSALADGDPASDVLLTAPAFVPSDTGASTAQQAALDALLNATAKAGFPVRVAIVPDAYDLGSVGELWAKPRTYAQFLGIELSLVYKGTLLVVMPNGVGVYRTRHSTASAYARLDRLTVGAGAAGLLAAAQSAVEQLAQQAGVKLPTAAGATANGGSSGGGDTTLAIVVAVLVVMVVVATAFATRRRRGTGARPPRTPRAPRPKAASVGGLPAWMQYAVPGSALVLVIVVGVFVVAVGVRHVAASASASASSVSPSGAESTPILWPSGRQAAPNFSLSDQNGQPVSVAAYRGHPVIVTFIDPLCRENCPLAAQVLSRADRELSPAQRAPILAVSVNIYGNARSHLVQDYTKWHLVPQWRWAVGKPKALASVWKRYYAEVAVVTKHIAGITVHYITHSEMAYVVDPSGYERALLPWPYTAAELKHAIEDVTPA
jgi:cytochrome oxidase Cu insertion factor (SCO1/SenC/PrrC family)